MLDLLKDLWDFMRERKKFWLAPIILVMLLGHWLEAKSVLGASGALQALA